MERPKYLAEIEAHFRIHSVCVILGPRQVGKTTLAKTYAQQHFSEREVLLFDLEDPLDLTKLDNPMVALSDIPQKLIVIDEIQRRPDLFPVLRVLVDRDKKRRFLILGSASRDLIKQSSETLAGRIGYIELPPFTLPEVKHSKQLMLRGGFPLSYLATREEDSYRWRQSYITTFLERDIPTLGFNVPPAQMRRFWLMLAHYHGQLFNASELSRSMAITDHMVRKYLDILAGTFMVRILYPWFENLKKRQVKSPKIYFRDIGVLNALIGVENQDQLYHQARLGALWEGFALEEVICALQATQEESYFWATQADAELDLLIVKHGKRLGFEFKYSDAPKITKSMRTALEDLKLDSLSVIYPGKDIFLMDKRIKAFGLETLATGEFMALGNFF